METNEVPIPDTPECVASHCGVWACRSDILTALAGQLADGRIQAVSREELQSKREAEIEYEVTASGIALIPVRGVMQRAESKFPDSCSTVRLRRTLRAASKDPAVRGVMLVIDSPGGHVNGQMELVEELAKVSSRVEVRAYVEYLCCSAACWLASGTSKIYLQNLSEYGNIGCFCAVYDESGKYEREGVKVHVISTGELKGAGLPGSPVPEAALAEAQKRVDLIGAEFNAAVAAGRGLPLEAVEALADGRCFTPAEAVAAGLADQISTLEEALEDFADSVNQKEAVKMAEENKQLEGFKALADSDGYEFACAHFGKSENEIDLARRDVKIARLEEENAQLRQELAAANGRIAELSARIPAPAPQTETPKAPGAAPAGFQAAPERAGEAKQGLNYNGKFAKANKK